MPHPSIILISPQMGENIGAAARAMHNFGLTDLRLVAPRDGWPNRDAVDVARNAIGIIENAKVFASVKEAVADINILYATTARPRDMVKPVVGPRVCATDIRQRSSTGNKCAIMFGPERTGLNNDDMMLADSLVTIPVSPLNPSLNLAQAVLVLCYELFSADDTVPLQQPGYGSGVATKAEITMLLEHLELELDNKDFYYPPNMRQRMLRNLGNIFTRTNLTCQETQTLRGVINGLAGKRESK
jgi:tRNA/rRNA methyltransferase